MLQLPLPGVYQSPRYPDELGPELEHAQANEEDEQWGGVERADGQKSVQHQYQLGIVN